MIIAFLETINDEIVQDLFLPTNNLLVTDTFALSSKEGVGYCYKYKGKKCATACKVSFIADTQGIVWVATVEPGNVHDAQIFRNSCKEFQPPGMVKCWADSGYVGTDLYNECIDQNIELVSQPRKTH